MWAVEGGATNFTPSTSSITAYHVYSSPGLQGKGSFSGGKSGISSLLSRPASVSTAESVTPAIQQLAASPPRIHRNNTITAAAPVAQGVAYSEVYMVQRLIFTGLTRNDFLQLVP